MISYLSQLVSFAFILSGFKQQLFAAVLSYNKKTCVGNSNQQPQEKKLIKQKGLKQWEQQMFVQGRLKHNFQIIAFIMVASLSYLKKYNSIKKWVFVKRNTIDLFFNSQKLD